MESFALLGFLVLKLPKSPNRDTSLFLHILAGGQRLGHSNQCR